MKIELPNFNSHYETELENGLTIQHMDNVYFETEAEQKEHFEKRVASIKRTIPNIQKDFNEMCSTFYIDSTKYKLIVLLDGEPTLCAWFVNDKNEFLYILEIFFENETGEILQSVWSVNN